jgi:hypothetical protein
MIEKTCLFIYRGFLLISFLLLLFPLFDKFVQILGYRLTFISFSSANTLQYASIFALFTTLLLLRQIRDLLKK